MISKISLKTADGRNVAWDYVFVILFRLFLVLPAMKHFKIKCAANNQLCW